jgi:hypothetical protein
LWKTLPENMMRRRKRMLQRRQVVKHVVSFFSSIELLRAVLECRVQGELLSPNS